VYATEAIASYQGKPEIVAKSPSKSGRTNPIRDSDSQVRKKLLTKVLCGT
jgi:hypothetical protein